MVVVINEIFCMFKSLKDNSPGVVLRSLPTLTKSYESSVPEKLSEYLIFKSV